MSDSINEHISERLEYLRSQLRAECISYGELAELEDLAEYIEPGDVELLEAAGVPEFPEERTEHEWYCMARAKLSALENGQDDGQEMPEEKCREWAELYLSEGTTDCICDRKPFRTRTFFS